MGCQCSKHANDATAAPAVVSPAAVADSTIELAPAVAVDVKPVQQAMAESPFVAPATVVAPEIKEAPKVIAEATADTHDKISSASSSAERQKSGFEDAKEELDNVNQSYEAYHSADSEDPSLKPAQVAPEAPKPKKKNNKPKRKNTRG
jgi:hypothetical protein